MAKTAVLKKQRTPEFDFSDIMLDSIDDDTVLDMMSGLMETSRHQQQTAIELTKLVVERNIAEPMNEEKIFATFKRAYQVVSEISRDCK